MSAVHAVKGLDPRYSRTIAAFRRRRNHALLPVRPSPRASTLELLLELSHLHREEVLVDRAGKR
eukprot:845945-Prymnesium_polylepis.1